MGIENMNRRYIFNRKGLVRFFAMRTNIKRGFGWWNIFNTFCARSPSYKIFKKRKRRKFISENKTRVCVVIIRKIWSFLFLRLNLLEPCSREKLHNFKLLLLVIKVRATLRKAGAMIGGVE